MQRMIDAHIILCASMATLSFINRRKFFLFSLFLEKNGARWLPICALQLFKKILNDFYMNSRLKYLSLNVMV